MIETLKEKLLSWSPAQANAFYNNVDRVGLQGGMIYEQTSTGWFLYSAEKAAYYDFNGESYFLEKNSYSLIDSLTAQKTYSDYADEHNLTKIEKPVVIDEVSIFRNSYVYYKTVRPYNTHGIPQMNMVYTTNLESDSISLQLVKDNLKKIDELFGLIDQCGGMLYPNELNTENLIYDTVTQNYFWGGDIKFEKTREDSINAHNEMIKFTSYYSSLVTGKSLNMQSKITNYVNTECSILQLPQ